MDTVCNNVMPVLLSYWTREMHIKWGKQPGQADIFLAKSNIN